MLREFAQTNEIEIELKKPIALEKFFTDHLFAKYPSLALRVADEQLKIRKHVAVFVGETHVRFLDNEKTFVEPDDDIHIFPAVSGG